MSEVIDRNAVKSKGGNSRSLSITNAYEPSEDSTAQREREARHELELAASRVEDSVQRPLSPAIVFGVAPVATGSKERRDRGLQARSAPAATGARGGAP